MVKGNCLEKPNFIIKEGVEIKTGETWITAVGGPLAVRGVHAALADVLAYSDLSKVLKMMESANEAFDVPDGDIEFIAMAILDRPLYFIKNPKVSDLKRLLEIAKCSDGDIQKYVKHWRTEIVYGDKGPCHHFDKEREAFIETFGKYFLVQDTTPLKCATAKTCDFHVFMVDEVMCGYSVFMGLRKVRELWSGYRPKFATDIVCEALPNKVYFYKFETGILYGRHGATYNDKDDWIFLPFTQLLEDEYYNDVIERLIQHMNVHGKDQMEQVAAWLTCVCLLTGGKPVHVMAQSSIELTKLYVQWTRMPFTRPSLDNRHMAVSAKHLWLPLLDELRDYQNRQSDNKRQRTV